MKILILESDGAVAGSYARALCEAGHRVVRADNTAAAIRHLALNPVDLLVTDLVVGTETALPVLDYVRMFRRETEVLLVTGSRLFPNGEMHFPDSAVAFRLPKPVALDELTALAAHVDRTGPAPRTGTDTPGPGVPRA